MAVGKIIISSNLKVLREVIGERNAYFVNNFDNIFEWKKKIEIAKNNRINNLIMGKNNLVLSKKFNHIKRVKNYNKLTAMHFFAWKKGLKTGIYYLRTKAKAAPQQFTIEPDKNNNVEEDEEECLMCGS